MAKIALLIGVSEYDLGLNPLPAAVKDLGAMREVLLHPDMGGFAESDVSLLKNPQRQAMEESIETLFANRHKDDLVLLFFSGHGIKDDAGRLYLASSQTRKTPQGELVRSSAVSANFVHENMSRSRSRRQVVILDSCFSGAFAVGLSAKDDGAVDIRTQLGGEGRVILTSSSSTQYSFEQEGEELSLYTRFLIEGIKTGEADQDGDDVISIDELHEYASRKVREVKPEVKPEIYAIREGFKIRLMKVPYGDPHQKYQKEVARCGKRGELTIVSRSILDTWRLKLGLSADEAKALEDQVLEPYRREFHQKLQQYEQTVIAVLRRDDSINDSTRQELQQLQQVLELRKEDTVPIEAKVAAYLKTYKQNLKTYQEAFSEALRQEYPLGGASRIQLQQMQKQLALSDADVAPIEAQITTEVESYRRNLQQYEQAFLAATQQEYPLSESKSSELRQYQSSLGLSNVEIAPIEAKVTTRIETYQQKLQQYREAFTSATQQHKRQPGEANRTQLRQTWQTLELDEADVRAVEAPILAQLENYQTNLRKYEQAFEDATEQHHPLDEAKRSELRQYQAALSLSDEDIAPIESQIIALAEERLQKIQQYEQVFLDSIQFEFPVSEMTREELRRFQNVLELRDEEIARIEEKVASQDIPKNEPNQQSDTSRTLSQAVEIEARENQSSALQEYELEVSKFIRYGVALDDSQIRRQLDSMRITLGLSRSEAEAIELRLTRSAQTPNANSTSNTAPPLVQPQYRQEKIDPEQSATRTPTRSLYATAPQSESTAQRSVGTPSTAKIKPSKSLSKANRRSILLGTTVLGTVLICVGFVNDSYLSVLLRNPYYLNRWYVRMVFGEKPNWKPLGGCGRMADCGCFFWFGGNGGGFVFWLGGLGLISFRCLLLLLLAVALLSCAPNLYCVHLCRALVVFYNLVSRKLLCEFIACCYLILSIRDKSLQSLSLKGFSL